MPDIQAVLQNKLAQSAIEQGTRNRVDALKQKYKVFRGGMLLPVICGADGWMRDLTDSQRCESGRRLLEKLEQLQRAPKDSELVDIAEERGMCLTQMLPKDTPLTWELSSGVREDSARALDGKFRGRIDGEVRSEVTFRQVLKLSNADLKKAFIEYVA